MPPQDPDDDAPAVPSPFGPRLIQLVDEVVAAELGALSAGELQARISAVAPQLARLEGWVRAAAGALDERCGGRIAVETEAESGRPAVRSVSGWVAEVRRHTPASVGSRLRTDRLLRTGLPLVAAAVLSGELAPGQAQLLARLVGRIEPRALAESEPELIAVAATLLPTELAAWVAHLIATHCEPELEADEATQQARRYLQTWREPDGTMRGRFVLSREDSEALLTALEPLARRDGVDDRRSAGQRRADALVDICELACRHGDLPESGGARPQLSYVLPADWAARQQAARDCAYCGRPCGEHAPAGFADMVAAALPSSVPRTSGSLAATSADAVRTAAPTITEQACATAAWSGPQTRARIETLLCAARITRVLLDGEGQVRGLSTLTDTPTRAQRAALAARDRGCAARGCTRPPALCDAHHLMRLADGGRTTLDNLVLLCRRHHVRWHSGSLALADLHVPWFRAERGRSPAPT